MVNKSGRKNDARHRPDHTKDHLSSIYEITPERLSTERITRGGVLKGKKGSVILKELKIRRASRRTTMTNTKPIQGANRQRLKKKGEKRKILESQVSSNEEKRQRIRGNPNSASKLSNAPYLKQQQKTGKGGDKSLGETSSETNYKGEGSPRSKKSNCKTNGESKDKLKAKEKSDGRNGFLGDH